jgi:hypothetical protein
VSESCLPKKPPFSFVLPDRQTTGAWFEAISRILLCFLEFRNSGDTILISFDCKDPVS